MRWLSFLVKFDKRHLELLKLDNPEKQFPSTQLEEFHRNIQRNYARIENAIDQEEVLGVEWSYPSSETDLSNLLSALHKAVFENSGLQEFGSFRRDNQTIVGYGAAQYDPVPFTEIKNCLGQLYRDWFISQAKNKHYLARKVANTLIDLFNIHPFRDGNGRVGRLLAKIIARHHDYLLHFSGENVLKEYARAIESFRKKDNSLAFREENTRSYKRRLEPFISLIEECLENSPDFSKGEYT